MILLSARREEEAVNLQGLRGTKGRVDKVNKEKVEEKAEEEVEKGALLSYWGVKCNILYILYR